MRAKPRPDGYPGNLRHLFSPVDRVHDALVTLVNGARHSLAAAMYGWDDEQIDGLFRSHLGDPGVTVLLALDSTQAAGAHERRLLERWPPGEMGNDLVTGRSSRGAISHDKMIVIDATVTILGSTNLSVSGETRQNNEMTVVWDPVFAGEARQRIDMIATEMRAQMAARR